MKMYIITCYTIEKKTAARNKQNTIRTKQESTISKQSIKLNYI